MLVRKSLLNEPFEQEEQRNETKQNSVRDLFDVYVSTKVYEKKFLLKIL